MPFIICEQWHATSDAGEVRQGLGTLRMDATKALKASAQEEKQSPKFRTCSYSEFHELLLKPFGNLKSDKWEYYTKEVGKYSSRIFLSPKI